LRDVAKYTSPYTHLPDEHMRLVGIIAAHWESVDMLLQRAVAEIMKLEFNRVRLLTETLSVQAKLDLIGAYARRALPKAKAKRFRQTIKAVQDAYAQRSAFVHAKWLEGPSKDAPRRVVVRTKGGKLSVKDDPCPVDDLQAVARQVFDAGQDLTLQFQRYGLLQPSP